jgi:hypothetical protein
MAARRTQAACRSAALARDPPVGRQFRGEPQVRVEAQITSAEVAASNLVLRTIPIPIR